MNKFENITLTTPVYWADEAADYGEMIIHESYPLYIKWDDTAGDDYYKAWLVIGVKNDTKEFEQNGDSGKVSDVKELFADIDKDIDTYDDDYSFTGVALDYEALRKQYIASIQSRINDMEKLIGDLVELGVQHKNKSNDKTDKD